MWQACMRIKMHLRIWWKLVIRRLLGRPRRRWEDNVKVDLKEIGCGCLNRIDLAEERDRWWNIVNTAMNLRAP
jgi:hypothetical protein